MSSGSYGEFEAAILDFDMTIVYLFDFIDIFALREELRTVLAKNGFRTEHMRSLPVGLLRNAYANDSKDEATRRERWLEASEIICRYEIGASGKAVATKDTLQFLIELRTSNLRTAIVSSNCDRAIERCLERLKLSEYIDVLIGRDELMWDMKPSPRGMDIALRRMAASPLKTFGIGDSTADIKSFRAAGVLPIGIVGGVSTRGQLLDAGAAAVITRLSQARETVLQATRYTSSVSES